MLRRQLINPNGHPGHIRGPGVPVEAVIKRHDWLVIAALSALILVSGAYTILGVGMNMSAWQMTAMPNDMPMPVQEWSPGVAIAIFLMWWVMMIAMMLPSAAPMILLFARVIRKHQKTSAGMFVAMFVTGYLMIWGAFSLAATVAHGVGEHIGWVNGMMAISPVWLNSLILLAAGIWQFLPIKSRCLDACRQPVEFLSKMWRPGVAGAFRMGVYHGIFCVGCCWVMMLLLFVGGVMNLIWIGGLALLVLVEKLFPNGQLARRLTGIALLGAGMVYLFKI